MRIENLKKVAVFDFDGTITKHDSLFLFILFAKGYFKFIVGIILMSPVLVCFKLGIISNEVAKQKLFAYYFKNMLYTDFKKYCISFAANIERDVRVSAINHINYLSNKEIPIYIVSASIDEWIIPWAFKNGIKYVIATKIEVNNGRLTGKFTSPNCYGIEKVNRIKEILSGDEYIYAYGDSKGDCELLKYAHEGFYQQFKK